MARCRHFWPANFDILLAWKNVLYKKPKFLPPPRPIWEQRCFFQIQNFLIICIFVFSINFSLEVKLVEYLKFSSRGQNLMRGHNFQHWTENLIRTTTFAQRLNFIRKQNFSHGDSLFLWAHFCNSANINFLFSQFELFIYRSFFPIEHQWRNLAKIFLRWFLSNIFAIPKSSTRYMFCRKVFSG